MYEGEGIRGYPSDMRLVDIHQEPKAAGLLWTLLEERAPWQSISHKKMPTWEEHVAFILSRPYQHWYLCEAIIDQYDEAAYVTDYVGAVYLTKQREIGVSILRAYRGRGFGVSAVKTLMAKHPGSFLANVNPANEVSAALFQAIGFRHVQNTYCLEAETT